MARFVRQELVPPKKFAFTSAYTLNFVPLSQQVLFLWFLCESRVHFLHFKIFPSLSRPLSFVRKSYSTFNKQLLDEVEHDIMNYQNRGLCYLPKPKAEADNTDTRF